MTVATRNRIHVEANSPGVQESIDEIVDVIVAAGAFVDPHLVVIESDGHLALGTTTGVPSQPFIALPSSTLVPIDGLTWDESAETIAATDGVDQLDEVHRTLLEANLHLLNSVHKRPWFLAHHPKAAAVDDGELCEAVQAIRPSFSPTTSVDALLKTRTFGLRSADKTRTSVIMPILELADHHPQGSPYELVDDVLTSRYRPVDDSGLTYVSYGPRRDAIDLAAQYGFATDTPSFLVSAPISLDLEGHGTLTIRRALDRKARPSWTSDAAGTTVDYLLLDTRVGLFDSLFLPVRTYLESRGVGRNDAHSLAMRACETVIHMNRVLLADLHRAAAHSIHGGGVTLAEAAVHQWEVLDAVESLG